MALVTRLVVRVLELKVLITETYLNGVFDMRAKLHVETFGQDMQLSLHGENPVKEMSK